MGTLEDLDREIQAIKELVKKIRERMNNEHITASKV